MKSYDNYDSINKILMKIKRKAAEQFHRNNRNSIIHIVNNRILYEANFSF